MENHFYSIMIGADLFLALLIVGIVIYEMRWRSNATGSINSLKIEVQDAKNAKDVAAMSKPQLDSALANDLGRPADPAKPANK